MEIKVDSTKRKNTAVALFGDSISKGLFLQEGKICRIGRNAAVIVAERYRLRIDNFSAFGQTLRKCREKRLFDTFLDNTGDFARKKAVIALGGNDCDYDWKKVSEDPFGYHLPNTPLPLFEEMLGEVTEKFKSRGLLPVFISLPPVSSQRYFDNVICKKAEREQILKFFAGDVTNIARHQECYNAAILKCAAAYGCDFIDFRTEFLLKTDCADYISDDGIHPNAKGHLLIADIVSEYIDGKTAAGAGSFRFA